MMRLFVLLALAATAGVPATARPACVQRPVASMDDPFTYLTFVIDSLGWIKQGRMRVENWNTNSSTDMLFAIKSAQSDYACATSTIKPFADSKDIIIQKSAQTISDTYETIAIMNQAIAQELVAVLDEVSTGKTTGAGTWANRMADLRHHNDEAWSGLVPAMISATYSLPMFQDERPTGRFRITKQQREQLKRSLTKAFGAGVRGGMKPGQEYVIASAAALYGFLADKKWRSSDSP